MDVNHYASAQEYSDPYDMHLHHHHAPFTSVGLFELAPLLSSPASTCSSRSYFHSSDSESSPGPSKDSDDATSSAQATPPSEPPQMEPPARPQSAETPVRPPGPGRPSSAPAPVAEDPTTHTGRVGRRAPKPRHTTRAVQPLACFFCRRRKIACGPPVNLGAGDRTCEYVPLTLFLSLHTIICAQLRAHVSITGCPAPFLLSIFGRRILHLLTSLFVLVRPCARRRLVCEYPEESYRGRRPSKSKTASGRPQRC
jgi:hypothetical protein